MFVFHGDRKRTVVTTMSKHMSGTARLEYYEQTEHIAWVKTNLLLTLYLVNCK